MTPGRLDLLARLGVGTIGGLLYHFPRAYEDLRDVRTIASLAPGLLQTVKGEVVDIRQRSANGQQILSVFVSDGGPERLEGVWFGQPGMARRFRYGQRVSFSGTPRKRHGCWQMAGPRVRDVEGESAGSPGVVPIYPLTEELRPHTLRSLIRQALRDHAAEMPELIPSSLRERHGFPGVLDALRMIHEPTSPEEARQARQRFAYEELFLLQVALAQRRREARSRGEAPVIQVTGAIDHRIRRLFPYTLTTDQGRAVAAIRDDLASGMPMQRLLQADVGAGKTAVAVYAMLACVANGMQAAMMAPTEVLARQHFQTLERLLAASRVRRALLTGGMSGPERRRALEQLREGDIDLVVGTQSLAQEGVRMARLGLVVIDEQHKFGVHQRARVKQMGGAPHYLVMTATPIPRTMALAVYGDLDVSLIRQLPPGRHPVATTWLREDERPALMERLAEWLRQGRQGLIVCPLVEESEKSAGKSAEEVFSDLSQGPLAEHRPGLLHGRMEEREKVGVMERFRRKELGFLVCTTVVEVGVDVPDAGWVVIEQAERYGLSQLHQLRGRVARGPVPGECLLFADPQTDEARGRLQAFLRTTDGFALAEEDARLRGSGDVFGSRQSGMGEVWLLAQSRMDLLERAHEDARALAAADPVLHGHPELRAALARRYGESLELSEAG
jgi:ATP-dependent DNA helicase RecG